MIIFEPDNKFSARSLLRELLISMVGIAVIIAVVYYVLDYSFPFTSYMIIAILLFRSVTVLFKTRVKRIQFDEENRMLTFLYQHGFGGVKERTIPFNEVRMEVEGGAGWFRKNMVLYFVRGKFDVFRLSGYNDGFSTPVLIAIREAAHNNGMRVSKY